MAELKGKSIGVTKVGAESYAVARAILTRAGLDPEKEADLVGVGGIATTASALKNNRCQAVIGWQPLTARFAAEGKAHSLADLNTSEQSQRHLGYSDYSFTIIQITDAYLKGHPQVVQKFVGALVAQLYFAGLALELITESVKQDREATCADGLITQDGHDIAVKVFTDAGLIKKPVPMDAIVDNSFTQKR